MRPRLVRRPGALAGLPTQQPSSEAAAMRAIEPNDVPVDSPELWVGVHIPAGVPAPTALPAHLALATPRDAISLEQLAIQAQRFTPRVSLAPPDGLLLEVKGSLHLFNGTHGLIQEVLAECGTAGIEVAIALAPTPLAALVGARVSTPGIATMQGADDEPFIVTNKAQLVGRLSAMPLVPLRWPHEVLERLARMGVRTIGQVLRLPRAGFARRFGPELLAELDRLTGRNADPRRHFHPRERFRRRRELTYELESNAALMVVLAPLLTDLGRFLQERQCGITELECRLWHRQAPPTECSLRLAAPVADVARLAELLSERLNALVLPEPVRSCEIRTGFPVLRVFASNSLWQPGEYGGSGGPQSPELIERLRARLGHEAVYGLQVLQGHRPENAWCRREPAVAAAAPAKAAQARSTWTRPVRVESTPANPAQGHSTQARAAVPWPAFRRPLWLLQQPELLEEVAGVPRRHGSLRLCGAAERVETGWWDGGDVGRDYYMAYDIHGVQLWIFRERTGLHRWFLHGVFG